MIDNNYKEQSQTMDDSHTIILTDRERDEIQAIIVELPQINATHLDNNVLLTQIALASQRLPKRLARLLIDFRRRANRLGTLLIRNLPTDPILPSTPSDGRVSFAKMTSTSEYSLLMTMLYLGEPIAYKDEKEGALIQNVCPVAGHEQKQENTGAVFLEFHTENAFHPFKPDFVGLVCIRSDHDRVAKTLTTSIYMALPSISDELIALLREPIYRFRLVSSFTGDVDKVVYSPKLAILTGSTLTPDMCYDFHAVEAIDPRGYSALKALQTALENSVVEVALLPGDLIIVDNRVVAHGRTSFQPRFDGLDRWLQRMYVVQDFRRSQFARPPDSHVCNPLVFDANNTICGFSTSL